MTIASQQRDQSVKVIEEYLMAAKLCINAEMGYPATLLLLCVIDSIGNGLLPPNGESTRLDILTQPPFSPPKMSSEQVKDLTHWYRNSLAHTGTLPPNVFLKGDTQGQPFEFDANDALTRIRVPLLYVRTRDAWDSLKDAFNPATVRRPPPDPAAQAPLQPESLLGVSGIVTANLPGGEP